MNYDTNQAALIALRQELHQFPELSGFESGTAAELIHLFKPYRPDRIIEGIGGLSLAVVFEGRDQNPGPTVLFRCELDALPIAESNDIPYRSRRDGISHACGHDGHIAIMAGFGEILAHDRPRNGRIVLFFQAEEETGAGAEKAIEDPKFKDIRPDYVFGLHNIPGFPTHTILTRPGEFSSASTGMIIKLKGRESHAAEPKSGINPARAVSLIVTGLLDLPRTPAFRENSTLTTIIMIRLGQGAFGISPGQAVIMATLRSYSNEVMPLLIRNAERIVRTNAGREGLEFEIAYKEQFPGVANNQECIDIVTSAARKNDFPLRSLKDPFPWSEDFSQFTGRFKGALFGLGAGEDHPPLHHPDYDFPDEIIATGVQMFDSIYRILFKTKEGVGE
ncbi:MAG: amidohydrolase [Candidatus Auribacterota bacterium]|nr:amidohydrolase [Candidatus Auribacterota bacterium]